MLFAKSALFLSKKGEIQRPCIWSGQSLLIELSFVKGTPKIDGDKPRPVIDLSALFTVRYNLFSSRQWTVDTTFPTFQDESFNPIWNRRVYSYIHYTYHTIPSNGFNRGSWNNEIASFQRIKRTPRYAQKVSVYHSESFDGSIPMKWK